MYWVIRRTDRVTIEPRFFASGLVEKLLAVVRKRFEHTFSPQYGLTLSVINLDNVGDGVLDPDTGNAVYNVSFDSLVFRPFKNEIVHATVIRLESHGLYASVDNATIFVPSQNMPSDLMYAEEDGKPAYRSQPLGSGVDSNGMVVEEQDEVEIVEGTRIRVRIGGLTISSDKISMTGTLNGDFLG